VRPALVALAGGHCHPYAADIALHYGYENYVSSKLIIGASFSSKNSASKKEIAKLFCNTP
jgi:hypothetical protein